MKFSKVGFTSNFSWRAPLAMIFFFVCTGLSASASTFFGLALELNELAGVVENSLNPCHSDGHPTAGSAPARSLATTYLQLLQNSPSLRCSTATQARADLHRLRVAVQTSARSSFGDSTELQSIQTDPESAQSPQKFSLHFLVWQILLEEAAATQSESENRLRLLRLMLFVSPPECELGIWQDMGHTLLQTLFGAGPLRPFAGSVPFEGETSDLSQSLGFPPRALESGNTLQEARHRFLSLVTPATCEMNSLRRNRGGFLPPAIRPDDVLATYQWLRNLSLAGENSGFKSKSARPPVPLLPELFERVTRF